MIYIEYEEYKSKYHAAQKEFNDILTEQEKLFSKTQPQSTDYSKDKVKSSSFSNPFANYVIAKQEKLIDERLVEARSILKDRRTLLLAKEEELNKSKDYIDIVYKLYYIDKLSIRKIGEEINYSKSQIYEILRKIQKNLK